MQDELCFVQFLHPGGEHWLDAEGIKAWTRVEEGHGRKFLRSPGRFLSTPDAKPTAGDLGFWGEWEASSRAEPVSAHVQDGPNWIHRPFWSHQTSYRGLHNTDPFVFGDRFQYTGCLQHTKHGPTQLRNLARGSVILFGSKRPGRPEFTVDTVFVVAGFIDHERRNYRRKLANVVSETYAAVTLATWYGETTGCTTPEKNRGCQTSEPDRSFRLYFGATFDNPVDGMFSFFPCITGDAITQGFARPALHIPGLITPAMTQSKKLNPRQSIGEITPLWDEVVRQVSGQGLSLGIGADLPELIGADLGVPAIRCAL